MSTVTGEPLQIAKVLNTSYAVSISRLSLYFVLGFLVGIPTLLIELLSPAPVLPWAEAPQDAAAAADAMLSPWIEGPLVLAGIVLGSIATAAATYMMIADLRGTQFNVAEALATGVRALLPVVGALILILLIIFAIGVGALTVWTTIALGIVGDPQTPLGVFALPLFVVPTVIVWLVMSVVVPVIVVERTGVLQSMRRSAEMTNGHLWSLFYVFAVFALLFVGVGVGSAGLAMSLFGAEFLGNPVYIVASQAIGTLVGVYSWALIAVVYYYLRTAEESSAAPASAA